MGLFFETWEVNDPEKVEEHDALCREWILEWVHSHLGKSAVPHKLYSQADNSVGRALSVEVESKAEMDRLMETLFANEKFMEYYEKWEKFIDEPPKRVFWDELSPDIMKRSYSEAKQND